MAHPEQIKYCESVKKLLPKYFHKKLVVDIGSLDVNGNNGYLFTDCLYIGVDISEGKNVDIVSKGHELKLPDESIDVVISTECFEHDFFYHDTIRNIVRILKPGGLFLFTCATTGRPEHGTRKTSPEDAPFIHLQGFEEWADYYKNLEEKDIREVINIEKYFRSYSFSVNTESKDLYFWGVKHGELHDRRDYSFIVRMMKESVVSHEEGNSAASMNYSFSKVLGNIEEKVSEITGEIARFSDIKNSSSIDVVEFISDLNSLKLFSEQKELEIKRLAGLIDKAPDNNGLKHHDETDLMLAVEAANTELALSRIEVSNLNLEIQRLNDILQDNVQLISGLSDEIVDYKKNERELNRKLQDILNENDDLFEANENLRHQLDESGLDVASANAQVESMQAELIKIQAFLGLIRTSTSWRLTLPIREFKRWFMSPSAQVEKYKEFISGKTVSYSDSTSIVKLIEKKCENKSSSKSPFDRIYNRGKVAETRYPIKKSFGPTSVNAKLIAFYLPQFHQIPENNMWWGEGFTEWSNVVPALPQFSGHYQPHIPDEMGYYNLLDEDVQRKQIDLAKLYGLSGFCFYFYWFGGKTLLEQPTRNYLNNSSLDFPFCLCWANENWSRRWDGLENDILISQAYSPEDDIAFIEYVSEYLKDPRYIKVDDKPLLIVYRPNLLPDPIATTNRWRNWCRENGVGEIFLATTLSFEKVDGRCYGFDISIEFPPNNSAPKVITNEFELNQDFEGTIFDWRSLPARSEGAIEPDFPVIKSVCTGWDNTARKKNKGIIFSNSSHVLYGRWLSNVVKDTVTNNPANSENLIFVNAWNEWAEGAHLEPDQKHGYAYLSATRRALCGDRFSYVINGEKNKKIAIVIHVFYLDVFEEILKYIQSYSGLDYKLYVSTVSDLLDNVLTLVRGANISDYEVFNVRNHGRDVLPFLTLLPSVIAGGHDYLIKVHTKKSLHREDGSSWRAELFDGLLSELSVRRILDKFETDSEVGIIAPDSHIVPMTFYWGSNADTVEELCKKINFDITNLSQMTFVAGTMFAARVDAVKPILDIHLSEHDFEAELGQVDGTMAHAIERFLSVICRSTNYDIHGTSGKESVNMAYSYAAKG